MIPLALLAAAVLLVVVFGEPWAQRAVRTQAERRERNRREAARASENPVVAEIETAVERQLIEPRISIRTCFRLIRKAWKGEPIGEIKL